MNYTRIQNSNKLAKAIAFLGASTLLSCSAVVLLSSQSALSGQPTSDAEQLLAQNSGRGGNDGGSDGLDGVNPSDPTNNSVPRSGTMSTPSNTGDVEDRQRLSPRLSDDPSDPVNRQEGGAFNDAGVGERQDESPRLEDNIGDRDALRDGIRENNGGTTGNNRGSMMNNRGSMMNNGGVGERQDESPRLEDNVGDRDAIRDGIRENNGGTTGNNGGSMMNNGGSMMNNGSAQQRQDLSPRLEDNSNANDDPTRPTPSVTTPRGGTSVQQPSYNRNTQPSYNQNTQPSYNQNTGGSSSAPVRGLW